MAEISKKVPENVEGNWFVDRSCIICNICEFLAPENFSMAENAHYISKQPQTKAEKELCEQAKNECPVKAIGNDAPLPEESASS